MSLEIPVAAISPQYGLPGAQPERLAHAASVVAPGAVFVDDAAAFASALNAPALAGLAVIVGLNPKAGDVTIDWLLKQGSSQARPRPDTTAKLLLTSGSTGRPKAVICLHSGVAVNAAQVTACYDDPEPPVVVNQAPWSHSLGANAILQMVLHRGGTHYIDAGAPVAGRTAETVRNLREIAPTYHNMVPAGWDLLAHDLEQDDGLARTFFSRVRVLLLNKDPRKAHTVAVRFLRGRGRAPVTFSGPAELYQYSSAQYVWHPDKAHGYPEPDLPPAHHAPVGGAVTLPPFSLSLLRGPVAALP